MHELLSGRLARTGYAHLLRNLHALYATLEAALQRHCTRFDLAPLALPELPRRPALEADLRVLHGADWAEALPLTATAQAYAKHLDALADSAPGLLAAHVYVRYLGDLHGGQILARRIADLYRLDGTGGIAFYRFPAPPRALIDALRTGLDAPQRDEAAMLALEAEARNAFERHIELFDALTPAR